VDVFLNSLANAVVLLGDPTLWAFILGGFLWGCLAGALPGISSVLAIGVVIPLTFSMDAPSAIGLIIGISVGMSYGNSIPAILLGVPPHTSAVLTAADGYALHKQGKSGKALAAQWLAATYGQLLSIFFFVAMVVPLSLLAYSFLSPELFALYLLGITALVALTGKSVAKGFVAAAVGFMIALVGPDPVGSVPRLEFGLIELRGGITEVAAVLGLLAGSELLRSMRQTYNWGSVSKDFSSKFMSRKEVLHVLRPMTIGGVLGSLLGAIPGFSGPAATFVAYQQAKLTSKTPELFGNGSLEGIASNEAAQNAAQGGEMVPTLGLGIPAKPEMVLLLGALTIQGLVPGSIADHAEPGRAVRRRRRTHRGNRFARRPRLAAREGPAAGGDSGPRSGAVARLRRVGARRLRAGTQHRRCDRLPGLLGDRLRHAALRVFHGRGSDHRGIGPRPGDEPAPGSIADEL
jgi:putative tricarboxylic transport membrane protein